MKLTEFEYKIYPEETTGSYNITEGNFSFIKKSGSNEDVKGSRVIAFEGLTFEENCDYEMSLNVASKIDTTFTIQVQSSGDTYQNQTFTLEKDKQEIVFLVRNPNPTFNNGFIRFALGLLGVEEKITFSNITLKKVKREERKVNILLIGNSFTNFYCMPRTLENMATINGLSVNVEQLTYNGYMLEQYLEEEYKRKEMTSKLDSKKWDFVILQDHSRRPLVDKQSFLESVRKFTELIKKNGAKTVLFTTWAYKEDSEIQQTTGYSYEEFHNLLVNGYKEAAIKFNIQRIPIGEAFHNVSKESTINLYFQDDYHPSKAGSYFISLLIYRFLFGVPENDEYIPTEIDKEVYKELQKQATNNIPEKCIK